MKVLNSSARTPRTRPGRAKLAAAGLALTTGAFCAGLGATALPASASAPSLSAASVSFGASTNYTLSDVPVASLSADGTTVVLSAGITRGTEALAFYNGASGYSVSYTPSGGSATADAVDAAAASGAKVTLTLATTLVGGDTLNINAKGTNPAYSTATQSNSITVTPGNGTAEATGSVTFGNSVSAITVVPAPGYAGAPATYTVSFKATDALSIGGDIFLSETAGPTNFSHVTSVEVSDSTQGWDFAAPATALASGTAKVPVNVAVSTGDSVHIVLANVTNPPAGTISDFALYTTADIVPADAATYTLSAAPATTTTTRPTTTTTSTTTTVPATTTTAPPTARPRPVITALSTRPAVSANTVLLRLGCSGATCRGTIRLYDGTSLLAIKNYAMFAGTRSSWGAHWDSTAVRLLDGARSHTLNATETVTVARGETVYKRITLVGPVVSALNSKAVESNHVVELKLHCGGASCRGTIALYSGRDLVAFRSYAMVAGTTSSWAAHLGTKAVQFLANVGYPTLKAIETVTVTDGRTVQRPISLVR
jgi:hypothetical protein